MDLICRTCLACDDELEPLFSKKLINLDYVEITEMILACTGLEILEDDKLSNSICILCIESTIAAFKYRKKVWYSYGVLLETTNVLKKVSGNDTDINKLSGSADEYESEHKANKSPGPKENEYSVSQIKEEHNSTGITSDNSSDIDELLAATPDNHKRYRDMDKYIRFSIKSPKIRSYECTICDEAFELIGSLRKHLLAKHNIPVLQTFKCITCLKIFVNELYFQRHLKEAHQPTELNQNLICDLCGKTFKFSCQLVDHINRHKGVKPFKCKICEFCAVSSTELKLHMRSHTGEKPYVCHICGVGYKSSSHRGAHIKEAHTEGRPYKCRVCAKSYKSCRVYMSHMGIHDPNQNIKCEICHKEFNYRKTLIVHMRQHGEKTFKCTVCEKAFYQRQNCQMHMKKIHDVKM